MATDFRVVIPSDMGNTIKLGAKEPNKYDVDVSQLDLPGGLTGLSLEGTVLTATTSYVYADGPITIDLATILPTVTAEVFLKQVERQGDKIVFTVGEQGNTGNDTTLEVDVADLLPVVADNTTITGTGVTANPLKVQLSQDTPTHGNNLLKQAGGGLYVSETDITNLITANAAPKEPRDIRLVNASGQTVIGYIHSTEQ